MSIKFKIPNGVDTKQPYTWLATWFGAGFLSPGPGTWGSAASLPFGIAIYMFGGVSALFWGVVIATLVGLWAAEKFDKAVGGHDSQMIVIDEVAGQWLALIPAGLNPVLVIISFIAFRFFDSLKPWPVSFFDQKVEGAKGVMGDDIVAGLMACVIVMFVDGYLI